MSDKFQRRRHHTGSTSARFKPSQLVPIESVRPSKIGRAGLAACGAVSIVALALIALVWIVTSRTVQEQRSEILERTEQALTGQAATMAETIAHELLLIDQSLTIIQSAWKADSETVDLLKWQETMPALTAVADDLFISDEKHIIRQDIVAKAVGQGVGAAYVTFPHGSLEQYESDGSKNRESLVLQGQTSAPVDARQFLMYIVRPLDHPKGWLVGAAYRSTELTKLFAQSELGNNPVVALVDTRRGVVQAVVGPAARRPKTDLSQTPLFGIINRSPSGTWIGETAIDGVTRIHAFHRVADRDMTVLVAANYNEAMAPADNLASGARSLALVATVLILFVGGLVLWELYTARGHRRQKRIFERNRSELERLRTDETTNHARAQLNAARLQAVLDNTVDGIALFNSSLRLVQWNHPFLRGIGIEPRQNMSLDAILREQAAKGLFGGVPDVEIEIARRVGILQAGAPAGLPQSGPNQEKLIVRGLPVTEGGFTLLVSDLATGWPMPAQPRPTEIDEPVAVAAPTLSAPIDW
jgi:PAS domain-containing protein